MVKRPYSSVRPVLLLCLGSCLALLLTLGIFQVASADPGVIYVDQDATGANDGSSWADAYVDLQDALAAAAYGDEIWVAEGVYKPGSTGERTATFTMTNGVALYGGFAGAEITRDARDWVANVTVLSGDIDNNDITNPSGVVTDTNHILGSNAYHVVTGFRVDQATMLDGFTVTAGQASGSHPSYAGGGMVNMYSNPTIQNTAFVGNYALNMGGGMLNEYSSPTVTDVIFSNNTASYDGGMSNFYCFSSPVLTRVTFSNNTGGGMGNWCFSSPTLTDVLFLNNSGGGMSNRGGSGPVLNNVIFLGNQYAWQGGGMYNDESNPVLINVTFYGNSATSGGAIYNDHNSDPTLVNCILWGNSANNGPEIYNLGGSAPDVTYSNVQGGYPGAGNLDADPLFADAAARDLRLASGSPAVNAGNDEAVLPSITTDLDGNPRFIYTVDMGAYEYQGGTPVPFRKAAPLDGDTSLPLTVTLSWELSSLTADYEYCVDASDNGACDTAWMTTTLTSAEVSGLSQGITYTWQVRAFNGEGMRLADGGAWWGFTSAPSAPGTFGKTSPADLSAAQPITLTLSWEASPGASSYTYCYDTSDDDACAGGWITTTQTTAEIAGLDESITTFWQVRAINSQGEREADAGKWWSFNHPDVVPGVIFVDRTASGLNNGESWTHAYTDLQAALGAARTGEEIWVAAGIYTPGSPGRRFSTFVLRDGVGVYGGFAGTELRRSERDWTANVTVLSGDIDNNDLTDPNGVVTDTANILGGNSYHVVTGTGTGSSTILDGFTITAGYADRYYSMDAFGGGMFNLGFARLALTHVTFYGNYAADFGSGMYNMSGSSPALNQVTFYNNGFQNLTGGGMFNIAYSSPVLTNVVFYGNQGYDGDGAVTNYLYSSPTLVQVTFSNNSGYGILNSDFSNPVLVNCILWGDGGQEIRNNSSSTASVSYSDVQGGYPGVGNIDANPLFANAAAGDLHLLPGSPAIDAGNSAACPAQDLDALPRPIGAGCDMGAYEWQNYSAALGMYASDLSPEPGQMVTFTVVLTNTGRELTGGLISDTLPAGVDFIGPIQLDPADAGVAGSAPPILAHSLVISVHEQVTLTFPVSISLDVTPHSIIINTVTFSAPALSGPTNASVILSIPNHLPQAAADTYTLLEENTTVLDVLENDSDADGDALSIVVIGLPDHGGTLINGGTVITYTPALDFTGTEVFTYSVADGYSELDTALVTMTVTGLNDPPVFTSTPALTAMQEALYTYAIITSDPDLVYGDALTITATTLPTWLTFIDHGDGTATLSGTPGNAEVGDHEVALSVSDSGGLEDIQTFTLTVINLNEPPAFTSTPTLTATQDTPYTYLVTATDPDLSYGDVLTITATTLPTWLTFTDYGDGTATLSGTPVKAQVGEHLVVLRVTDVHGETATQSFRITVVRLWRYVYLPLVVRDGGG